MKVCCAREKNAELLFSGPFPGALLGRLLSKQCQNAVDHKRGLRSYDGRPLIHWGAVKDFRPVLPRGRGGGRRESQSVSTYFRKDQDASHFPTNESGDGETVGVGERDFRSNPGDFLYRPSGSGTEL